MRVIDLSQSDGQLVFIGTGVVMPTSNTVANAATTPLLAGALRYNPTLDHMQYLSNSTASWLNVSGSGGADLAERYESDVIYDPGTVVVIGGSKEITQSVVENDTKVIGIISTSPGYTMNMLAGDDSTHPYVALKGRVPCKVVGPISKGDLLVTSNIAGHAMSNNLAACGTIVGKALEDFFDDQGVIEVVI